MNEQLLQQGFNVLSSASVYALVAIGLSVIFVLSGIINIAYGDFMTLGAYVVFVVAPGGAIAFIWGFAASAVAVAAFLLPALVHGTMREKEDWRGAYAVLAGQVRAGDLIVICPGWKYPAFRHAAARPLPAALLIPLEPEPILEEQPFGADAQWAQTYFASLTEPLMRSWIGGSARPHRHGRMMLERGASIWLVGTPVNLVGPEDSETDGSMRGVGAPCCQPLIIDLSFELENEARMPNSPAESVSQRLPAMRL